MLPRVKGLRPMYHSLNMFYVLVSTDGELEYLKPTEKALRSKEVTILSRSKLKGCCQWSRRLVYGFFATLLGG